MSSSPGSEADGVTVDVPVEVLNRVKPEDFAWQVPGLRQELVTALIKTLPKPLRVRLVPAPDTARQLLERLAPREEHLLHALSREARALRGVDVPPDAWDLTRIPSHLRPTFRVVSSDGSVVGEGKDLADLQASLAGRGPGGDLVGRRRSGGHRADVVDDRRRASRGDGRGGGRLPGAGRRGHVRGAAGAARLRPGRAPRRGAATGAAQRPVTGQGGVRPAEQPLQADAGDLREAHRADGRRDRRVGGRAVAGGGAHGRGVRGALPVVRGELPETLLVVLRAVEEVLGLAGAGGRGARCSDAPVRCSGRRRRARAARGAGAPGVHHRCRALGGWPDVVALPEGGADAAGEGAARGCPRRRR